MDTGEAKKIDWAWAVAKIILVGLWVLQAPWRPAVPGVGIDPSWLVGLSAAFKQQLQFGTDIIFTYGPLGTLATGLYEPDQYPIAIAFWSALHLLCGVSLYNLLKTKAWSAWAVVCICLILNGGHEPDSRIFAAELIFLIASQGLSGPRERALTFLFGLVFGWAALMKLTYAVTLLFFIFLIDGAGLLQRRKIPLALFGFLIGIGVGGWVSSQSIRNIVPYLSNSLKIVAAYGGAMQSFDRVSELIFFLVMSAALLGLVTWREWKSRDTLIDKSVFLLCWYAIWFITLKEGFVRQDSGHVLISWILFSLMCVVYLVRWAATSAERKMNRVAASFSLLGLIASVHVTSLLQPHLNEVPMMVAERLSSDFQSTVGLVLGKRREDLNKEYHAAIKAIAAAYPLRGIEGPADIYPVQVSVLLANGIEYSPRPIYQSYQAYSGPLMRSNRNHLIGEGAPKSVLLTIDPIDQRFPTLDDSLSWPEIFSRYEFQNDQSGFLNLKRREAKPAELTEIESRSIRWDETVDLKTHNSDIIWAEIEPKLNLFGKLMSAILKPPLVWMSVDFGSRKDGIYRLIPDISKEGFLLNPVLSSRQDVVGLAQSASGKELERVDSIRVYTDAWAKFFFEDSLRLSLKKMKLGRNTENEASRKIVSELLYHREICRGAKESNPKQNLSPKETAKHVTLEYRACDLPWQSLVNKEVCFTAAKNGQQIFRRCLNPFRRQADRELQHDSIAIGSADSGELNLEIEGSTRESRSGYWKTVTID